MLSFDSHLGFVHVALDKSDSKLQDQVVIDADENDTILESKLEQKIIN